MQKRSGYLHSLDGWRAIAILAVLWIHELPLTFRGRTLEPYQRLGSLGVVLFFAISGILISGRILEEEALTGRFHLKKFYLRRVLRIQPAMWAYLVVIALLVFAGVLHEAWSHWFAAVFLYENFLYRESGPNEMVGFFTGHFWTLAVEEHFYLLISLALFFVRRRRVLVFGVALLLLKVGQELGQHLTSDPLLRRTYWQMHMLLWPSFAAMALRLPQVRALAQRWLQPWAVFAASVVLCWVADRRSPALAVNLVGWLFVFWVIATMLHARSWTTRVLEWAPLRFVGRISYSIYLWHVLFYSRIAQPPVSSRVLLALSERPWKYVCTLLVAIASYYWIEKPMVRLGHRLAPPATAGHRDYLPEPTSPIDDSVPESLAEPGAAE